MIESLTFDASAGSKFAHAAKIGYFKANPVTRFKPGLNIVYGPNGSGKSTLLKLMGLSLAAVQGGASTVTQSWISDVFEFGRGKLALPCSVVHDGQPVMYYDAREVVGLFSGAAFDDDFFSQGINACLSKGSVGELNMHRVFRHLDVLNGGAKGGGFPSEVEWKYPRTASHAQTKATIEAIHKLFEARCDKGPQTLMFDEPESGFSMSWQAGIWRNIFAKVDPARFQVIVATHSPFALRIPGANYVEMEPGYAQECLLTLLMDLRQKVPALFVPMGNEAPSATVPASTPAPSSGHAEAQPAETPKRTRRKAADKPKEL